MVEGFATGRAGGLLGCERAWIPLHPETVSDAIEPVVGRFGLGVAWINESLIDAQGSIRSARQIINENLRPLNLSSAEGNILLHLLTQDQEMGQEQLDISKPAVSRALDSLETKGYVTRQRDPDDKRAHRVRLTGKALEIGPAVEQVYNHVYTLHRLALPKRAEKSFRAVGKWK